MNKDDDDLAEGGNHRVLLKGELLRRDRRKRFPSARGLAAVCGASEPTIYRAERGGPILLPYLRSIAVALDEDYRKYLAAPVDGAIGGAQAERLKAAAGSWWSVTVRNMVGAGPTIREAEVMLEVANGALAGTARILTPSFESPDRVIEAKLHEGVLAGHSSIPGLLPPDGHSAFMMTMTRGGDFGEGYVIWFDETFRQLESTRLFMVRRGAPSFDRMQAEVIDRASMACRIFRLRKMIESHAVSLDDALRLVFTDVEAG